MLICASQHGKVALAWDTEKPRPAKVAGLLAGGSARWYGRDDDRNEVPVEISPVEDGTKISAERLGWEHTVPATDIMSAAQALLTPAVEAAFDALGGAIARVQEWGNRYCSPVLHGQGVYHAMFVIAAAAHRRSMILSSPDTGYARLVVKNIDGGVYVPSADLGGVFVNPDGVITGARVLVRHQDAGQKLMASWGTGHDWEGPRDSRYAALCEMGPYVAAALPLPQDAVVREALVRYLADPSALGLPSTYEELKVMQPIRGWAAPRPPRPT